MSSENTIETAAPATETAATTDEKARKPQAPRRRGVYDAAKSTISVTEANVPDRLFDFGGLPEAVKAHCALHGAWMLMRAAETPEAGWEMLTSGKVLEVASPAATASEEPNGWKKAVAAALIEMATHQKREMTEAEANNIVSKLDRKAMAQARLDPHVIKHFQKLFPEAKKEGEGLMHDLVAGKVPEPAPKKTKAAATPAETNESAPEPEAVAA